MRIREHEWNTIGRCQHCGAATWERVVGWLKARYEHVPDSDERQCLWRNKASFRPEPQRRRYAYEDAETIAGRVEEIRREEQPRCPRNNDTLLYTCLRSTAACPGDCVLKADWIGPQ